MASAGSVVRFVTNLRRRAYYDLGDMIMHFKTLICDLIEYHHGAIPHACESSLVQIDSLQNGFVRDIGLTSEMTFLDFNLASSCLRRDIGVLDSIHKRFWGVVIVALKSSCRPLGFRGGGILNKS